MAFGEYLKDTLKEYGKSVYWLSKQTGIPKTTLYSLIKRDGNTDLFTMASIMAAFGETIHTFVSTMADNDRVIERDEPPRVFANQEEMIKGLKLAHAENVEFFTKWKFTFGEKDIDLDDVLEMLLGGLTAEDITKLFDYANYLRSKHKKSEEAPDTQASN